MHRQMEQPGHQQRAVHAEEDENEIIGESAPQDDPAHAVTAQVLRQGGEAAALLAEGSRQRGTAIEHHLLQDHHHGHVHEEHREGDGRIELQETVVLDRLDELHGVLPHITGGRVALRLDTVHFIQHHLVGRQRHVFIVEEGGHVGIGGNHPLLHPVQFLVEIRGDADDAMDLLLFQEPFRLVQRTAVESDGALPRGVQFPDIAAAVTAAGQVHDGHRHLIDHSVSVNPVIEQRIHQAREAEDQHDAVVPDDHPEFVHEESPGIPDPLAQISMIACHGQFLG